MQVVASHVLNAFLLSVVLVLVLKRAAAPLGLIDFPNERKVHEGGVPVIGGIAMFCAFVLTSAMLDAVNGPVAALVGGAAVLVATGVVDDRVELGPKLKLVAQLVAAVMFVLGAGAVVRLGVLPGWGEASVIAVPFTLVFIVGLINAFNMFDGIDGLAGGAAASSLFWLAVVAAAHGRPELTVIMLLLAGIFGFLVFNFRHRWLDRATVFMGDAGSMMLGGAVAFFVVALSAEPAPAASFPALLWVCIVPVIDTVSLALRRMQDGRSPFSPDRNHLHHIVLATGRSPRGAAALITAVCFVLGGVGTAGAMAGVPDAVLIGGLGAVALGHTAFLVAMRARRRGERPVVRPTFAVVEGEQPGERGA